MTIDTAMGPFEHDQRDVYDAEAELLDDEATDLLGQNLEEEKATLENPKELTEGYDYGQLRA